MVRTHVRPLGGEPEGSSQGVWVGLNEENEVDEVSIALHPGSLQPVPRTPAVDQAAQSLALLALRLSGVPERPRD